MNDVDVQETCRLSDSRSHCNMVQVEKILPALPHLVPGVHWELRPRLCKNIESQLGLDNLQLLCQLKFEVRLKQILNPKSLMVHCFRWLGQVFGSISHFQGSNGCASLFGRGPEPKCDTKIARNHKALRHLCSTMRLELAIPRISGLLKGRDEISRTRADFFFPARWFIDGQGIY